MSDKGHTGLPRLRVGLLRLTDTAPVIVAHEFGFFADEGVEVEIVIEPSWANVADKLAFGMLDAAVIVPPLAFAVELGLRGAPQPLIVPYNISLGGNTVTLARDVAAAVKARAKADGVSIVQGLASYLQDTTITLGVVHPYSTHNLLLRYWLATAGIVEGKGVKFVVVPPARATQALKSGHIAGFCAGAPWGKIAERAEVAVTVATSKDIWRNAPEKVFAVRAKWAEDNGDALQGALRALLRASQFCDAPENASYTTALLSRRQYLNAPGHAVLKSLPGGTVPPEDVAVFFRHAATFPWRSHGLWMLTQMKRWALLDPRTDIEALAARVYQPSLYRAAAAALEIAAPRDDVKDEGAHAAPWSVPAAGGGAIPMEPDLFCDGQVFSPVRRGL